MDESGWAGRFFSGVTALPKTVVVLSALAILVGALNIRGLQRDASADAYLPVGHPAVLYRNKVRDIFGLDDPLVVAVIRDGESGVFNPQSLALVRWIAERLAHVDNVDPERITSLVSAKHIAGTAEGMTAEEFLDELPRTQAEADRIRRDALDSPLYTGRLVTRDGTGTLIVAELIEPELAPATYLDVLELLEQAPVEDEQLHVAGEGAVRGYLQIYMAEDSRRMTPLTFLVIMLVLYVPYRTARSVLLPLVIVLGTLTVTIGSMVAAGIPFYVVTNALPVILIGISVADSLHIFGQYYEELAREPGLDSRSAVLRTMCRMWLPVTLTTLTTMAGFAGIFFAEVMPPMSYFGLLAGLGVFVALVYSLVFLPAALVLMRPRPSRAYRTQGASRDLAASWMAALGRRVYRASPGVVVVGAGALMLLLVQATQVSVDEERISSFRPLEPLPVAHRAINQRFDGTSYLDVVVDAGRAEGIVDVGLLREMEELQHYLETLEPVGGTSSIVDYLKQINRSLHENRPEAYTLPDSNELLAQYLLLYSTSGDPEDFTEHVDYDYRLANIRASLDSGRYSVIKDVVEAAQRYIDANFRTPGAQVNLSGRVNVDYHWISTLGASHFRSLLIALVLVAAMAALMFRSLLAGLLVVTPVVVAVVLIYAVMARFDVWIGSGTSAVFAIALGLGVDFPIHTLEKLVHLVRDRGLGLEQAMEGLYVSTGRALFFNLTVLGLGFGVLLLSHVLPLVRFGGLVVLGLVGSFLGGMTLLPALVRVINPAFLRGREKDGLTRAGDAVV